MNDRLTLLGVPLGKQRISVLVLKGLAIVVSLGVGVAVISALWTGYPSFGYCPKVCVIGLVLVICLFTAAACGILWAYIASKGGEPPPELVICFWLGVTGSLGFGLLLAFIVLGLATGTTGMSRQTLTSD